MDASWRASRPDRSVSRVAMAVSTSSGSGPCGGSQRAGVSGTGKWEDCALDVPVLRLDRRCGERRIHEKKIAEEKRMQAEKDYLHFQAKHLETFVKSLKNSSKVS